ncbi:MAG TPA: hypothetical protein VF092_16845 [Longimicrobium sp.]
MRKTRALVLGACVAAALGFGTAQAVAVPAAPDDGAARKCNPQLCDRLCKAIGAFSGTCTPGGGCACAL